jgi:hypothetical protein
MKDDRHERARRLIDQERVEGLATEDRRWLQAHLGECEGCERWLNRTEAALRALANLPVSLPPGLAAAAGYRVRREAEARRQRRVRNLGLALGCSLSWTLGVASAPLVWRVCAWLGAEFDLPRVVWVLGFAAWWLVPASAAAALILWHRERLDRESQDGVLERRYELEK